MNKFFKTAAFIIMISAIFSGCASDGSTVVVTKEGESGRKLTVVVEKGSYWGTKVKINPVIAIKSIPQIAVWVEDTNGNYIETLFVTKKAATQNWAFAPKEARRLGSLPYWARQRGVVYEDGNYLPTREDPLPDAITAASPKSSFQLQTVTGYDADIFVVLAEVSVSFDFNDVYNTNGIDNYNGQPAVVYAAIIDLSSGNDTFEMVTIGHSVQDGSTGELTADLSELTTALEVVEKIVVKLE